MSDEPIKTIMNAPPPVEVTGASPTECLYLKKTWANVERLQMALTASGPPTVRSFGRLRAPSWLPNLHKSRPTR